MMNSSYAPWSIPVAASAFTQDDLLDYLLRFAVLAPSSHNTQPWLFKLHPDQIELRYDDSRRLVVADPDNRQLYLSLGAAIENIARAALSIGKIAKITYVLKGDLVATIGLGEGTAKGFDWRPIIMQRRSTRLPFDRSRLPKSVVNILREAQHGTTDIRILEDSADIESVALINSRASERALSEPGFRRELVKWVRNNWTKQADGMPGFVQNIPGPVSLLAPVVMRLINIGPDQAKKDYALFSASPAVIILSVAHDLPQGWLDAGRSLQGIWLEAERSGYQVSALASAIEDDRGVKELTAVTGSSGRPVAVMRVGKASHLARHSPRLSAESVTSR